METNQQHRPALSKDTLSAIGKQNSLQLPAASLLQLPEKVLQFGTGVLLRGLPDYYIDKANKQGVFNGRIVVVKSTGSGGINEYETQDNLYTHCIKGIVQNEVKEEYVVNASVSRVISAADHWSDILACAANPDMQIIISNTTEVGIRLMADDDIQASPPQSFPGKLLAFLLARYKVFGGSPESGMIIIPTELLVDNGIQLRDIVLSLAKTNGIKQSIIDWIINANDWCNSLVDRIVPGALPAPDKQALQEQFRYTDELAIMSEPYSLWAIETKKESTKKALSFRETDETVIVADDIKKYRELKLRLLNGSHTFSCALAFLSGFNLVNVSMKDADFLAFLKHLMYDEILPCLIDKSISYDEAKAFAGSVIDRFSNPFIQHKWISISVQYTGKIKQRCVPLLLKHYSLSTQTPQCMALGFAAYFLFMKVVVAENGNYYGERNGERYPIQDEEAAIWYDLWQTNSLSELAKKALSDTRLWGQDLSVLSDFTEAVSFYLQRFSEEKKIYAVLPFQK